MFSAEVWGVEMRDVGYVHARSGAAKALLQLGNRDRARAMAEAELADVRAFGASRALGVALRVAGLTRGGAPGLELLDQSVATLSDSPALLERAHSLVEFGAALRRAGRRVAAREPLARASTSPPAAAPDHSPPAHAKNSPPAARDRGVSGAAA
jgi:hypothetical protein